MKTPFPEKLSEAESIREFADECMKKPGMYLMALRTHLNSGQRVLGEMIHDVAAALPAPRRVTAVEDRE